VSEHPISLRDDLFPVSKLEFNSSLSHYHDLDNLLVSQKSEHWLERK
jgi:hypothetical protein